MTDIDVKTIEVSDTENITNVFIASAVKFGWSSSLFAQDGRVLSYRAVFRAAFALGLNLGLKLGLRLRPQQRVGILLPSSLGAAVFFYACIFRNISTVMLNPGAGEKQIISALKTAQLSVVYTSSLLLKRLPAAVLLVNAIRDNGVEVVFLEDLRTALSPVDKCRALLASFFPTIAARLLAGMNAKRDDVAAVLFTSGSESAPKGVALSHGNLIVNSRQIMSRLTLTPDEKILNALPVFHSFGLMVGLVLPVVSGVAALQYPTPLHYEIIPNIIRENKVTIFFSSDTFLSNYGRQAKAGDFTSLRLVFAGAEKLKPPTRQLWLDKFNIDILEGYGVTETSPVISFNTPDEHKPGSVGKALPAIELRLLPEDGITEGGRLAVKAPNVMLGYFLADAPGVLAPPPDGWHDTGDIADIDAEGYISILGRAKRFIKTAGEMVSLAAIEEVLYHRFPENGFAVVGVANEKRGEEAVLLTTLATLDKAQVSVALQGAGLPELWTPRQIITVDDLPLLPSGKTNYPAVLKLCLERINCEKHVKEVKT